MSNVWFVMSMHFWMQTSKQSICNSDNLKVDLRYHYVKGNGIIFFQIILFVLFQNSILNDFVTNAAVTYLVYLTNQIKVSLN